MSCSSGLFHRRCGGRVSQMLLWNCAVRVFSDSIGMPGAQNIPTLAAKNASDRLVFAQTYRWNCHLFLRPLLVPTQHSLGAWCGFSGVRHIR